MIESRNGDFLTKYILHNQILVAVAVILAGWFLFQIRDILMLIFFSYIIMASLNPFVDFLIQKKVPKVISILLVYAVVVSILFLTIFPLIPFFAGQIQSLLMNFPRYLDEVARMLGLDVRVLEMNQVLSSQLANISGNAVAITTSIFGVFFSLITIFVVSLYLLIYRVHLQTGFVALFPRKFQDRVKTTLIHLEEKLGAWLRGQLFLSFLIGIVTYIAYSALDVEYALPLAVIAGLFEAIPTIGPIIGVIPAIIVSLTVSPTQTLLVVLTYLLIQTVEANFIVPKVMQRAVGLNPIAIILAVMIGAKLFGIMGALLSIPFAAAIVIIYNNIRNDS